MHNTNTVLTSRFDSALIDDNQQPVLWCYLERF